MEWIQILLLAFIQALTEFLPISSSGHLLFLKGLWGIEEMPILFDTLVHLGSLLAILVYFRREISDTIRDAFHEIRTPDSQRPRLRFLIYILISTGVTGLFFVLLKDPLERAFHTPAILPWTYAVTTLVLLGTRWAEGRPAHSIAHAGWTLPVLAGLFQGLAVLPGVSRSGLTIAILLFCRIEKKEAAFYAFFLAIPAIVGGFLFELHAACGLTEAHYSVGLWMVAFVTATFFSYLFLGFLQWIIARGRFWMFGLYTLGMVLLSAFLF